VPAPASQTPRVLADGWYSWVVPGFHPLTAIVARWPRWIGSATLRHGPLRAVALALGGTRCDAIAVIRSDPGWRSLLLIRAVFGRRRKLVALHFIDHAPRPAGLGRAVDRAWRPVEVWATRRALAAAQVLSPAEVPLYAGRFGVPEERFRLLRFAWRMTPAGEAPPAARDGGPVVAAGRAHCDWPTLFAAAAGSGWPLVVVCGEHDRAAVDALNGAGDALTNTGAARNTVGAGHAGAAHAGAAHTGAAHAGAVLGTAGAARGAVHTGAALGSAGAARGAVHSSAAPGTAGAARVLSDISHDAARALLREATVCVLAMHDAEVSHGHVRLCDAVDAGAAIVASSVRSLDGYVEDGRTAVLVPPGDAGALRAAVDALLADPGRRAALAAAAFERAEAWTWPAYLAAIDALVTGAVAGAGA
jgi:hypothetical protein